jgi:phosphate starvation-inducible PhoH-like protein
MAFAKELKTKEKKTEVKFNFSLNEEQKLAKSKIIDSVVSVLLGKAGSGKSTLASQIALDMLFNKEVEKIIVTRAMVVAGNEEIGFLPGGVNDKLAPFTAPVYDCMNRLYKKELIEKLVAEGKIEVIPFAWMRGRNFSNCVIICDEFQNSSLQQTELILTRLCLGSKIILCGDGAQIDLKDKKQSALSYFIKMIKDRKGFSVIKLEKNHRHPIVDEILTIFEEIRD